NMPVLDGIGATKKIRETDKIIPIIAVTACVEDHFRRETKEVGMNDFIGKPFNRKILYSTINKHVS
ncbi:MAG: response regulator, partial [Bacteroidota bacterium]|nr:response regulator [Bacteroidota bacterium]